MGTLNEDLTGIKAVEDKLTANKLANFAYTDHAYANPLTEADGVEYYDVNSEQNIPVADPAVMTVNETVLTKGMRSQASSLPRMLLNHFFGRTSYNLNKVNDLVSSILATLISHLGTANGLATLDGTGKLPEAQLPTVTGRVKSVNTVTPDSNGNVTLTKSDVGLGNVPNVATNNQTPTYTEASTLTALSSGEKLSVAFGKLAKAVSTLISHVANTNNPHSVTKAQVGLGSVVNTGDSATPVSGGTTKFTTGGAYTELNKKQNKTLDTAITIGGTSRTTVQTALEALNTYKADFSDLAPDFSTSVSYAVGDYVTYNGNMYRCTTAHSAGAWNNAHFTAVTVGDEFELKADKTSLTVPSDAVIHYSFDDVPDLPDGTAFYRRNNDFTSSDLSSWSGGSNVATLENGKIVVSSIDTAYFRYTFSTAINNPTIKIKFKLSVDKDVLIYGYVDGTSTTLKTIAVKANEIVEIAVAVSGTLSNLVGFSGLTTGAKLEVMQIYIGDGSYVTSVIDNSGNKCFAGNNGAVAVQGVCGKGICTPSDCLLTINNTSYQALPDERSISVWVNLPDTTWSTNARLWRFNLAEYVNIVSPKTLSFRTQNTDLNLLYFNKDMTDYLGKWTHIAIVTSLTSSSGNKKVYINGIKVGDVSSNYDFRGITDSTLWNLFSFSASNSNSLEGAMYDDFQLFNRALSDDEITALYLNKANTPKFCETLDVPVEKNQTAFSMAGAYDFFGGTTTSKSWLGKVFGHLLGRTWRIDADVDLMLANTNDVKYANGMWVAVTSGHGGIYWSTDGKTWTKTTTSSISSYTFTSVDYANGIWVACCGYSNNYGAYWSTDGKTWTRAYDTAFMGVGHKVKYANGIWVYTSTNYGAYWSTDGKTWTAGTSGSYVNGAICYNSNLNIWVATSYGNIANFGGIYWSTDGKTWTKTTTTGIKDYKVIGVTTMVNLPYFVAWTNDSHGIWTSTDGKTWVQTITTGLTDANVNDVHMASDICVASTAQGIYRSLDHGNSWQRSDDLTLPTSMCYSSNYANGIWVLISQPGIFVCNSALYLIATPFVNIGFQKAYYANGTWIAFGGTAGNMAYSDVDMLQEYGTLLD